MGGHRPRLNWRRSGEKQPGPPVGGLPAQRMPRWVARGFQCLVLPFMLLDLLMQWVVRRISPPPYEIKGQCKMRGNCCHYILMEWPPIMEKWPWFGRFWMWWYTEVHGFYQRGFEVENEDGRVAQVMSCRHLQADGSCGNYRLRPAICRQWPRMEYTKSPYILKGCGYFAVPREPDAKEEVEEEKPIE